MLLVSKHCTTRKQRRREILATRQGTVDTTIQRNRDSKKYVELDRGHYTTDKRRQRYILATSQQTLHYKEADTTLQRHRYRYLLLYSGQYNTEIHRQRKVLAIGKGTHHYGEGETCTYTCYSSESTTLWRSRDRKRDLLVSSGHHTTEK